MKNRDTKKPTDSELEILRILWDQGASTVRQVHEILSLHKESGYTTTLKLLQIMHEKGLVKRDGSCKTHIYTANITRSKTQHQFMNRMIENLYEGSCTQLVMQALGSGKQTREELEEIQKMLNELREKQG